MKTLKKLKVLSFATLLLSFTLSAPAQAGTGKGPSEIDRTEKYAKDYSKIKEDLANIQVDKLNIKCLKEKLRSDRSSGLKETTIADRKALMKTKADLKRDKCYLKADKKSMAITHSEAVRSSTKTVRQDKRELARAKKKVKKHNSGSTGSGQNDIYVTFWEKKLEKDRELVKQEKSSLENDRVAINKEIQRSNSEFENMYANNTYTCTPNRIMK